jgi:hypothetical protein
MHRRPSRMDCLAKAPSAILQYGSERGICNAFLKPPREAMKAKRQGERVGAQALRRGEGLANRALRLRP